MRRWGIAIVVVLAAIVGGAPAAHADMQVPATYGTATGWLHTDTVSCWGRYELDGHFAFQDRHPVDTIAVLSFSSGCPVYPVDPWTTNGTIEAPEFSGRCYVAQGQLPTANSVGGVRPYGRFRVECTVTMADDGAYDYVDVDILLSPDTGLSENTTGMFRPTYWGVP